ncbi:multidrug effflux MFS transporter [Vibrio marisflavi]|uniref:Bcr/CflA family efflux transporter n=1 Tax=Vibrio marisflavi CECT 7928 TaxID=634439 RepID=A0ABN8E891_9VIBR|nr:multidrug effflux MFS transporter [Vibrio marisflavi]CAH0542006.1 Multidrug resistance protein MdtL [Vibrio marisflavi CECT 7928]
MTNSPSKGQVMMLVLLVLFSPLAIDIYLPALPNIAGDLNVASTVAQDTITWFMFSMGLGQLFAGPLADKFGRKTIAVAGVVIYALSAWLAYLAQSIEWLLLARLLQGFGACSTSVAAFASVRDLFGPSRSGKMISYLNGAICFIPALAPILGSWLTIHFGWRSNFSLMAIFAVVVGLLVVVSMKESHTPSSKPQKVFNPKRYWSVLKQPTFIFHSTMCLLAMAAILAYVTSAPVILMEQQGLSMTQFTMWFSINAVVNIIACMVAPKVMDKIGTHKCLIIGSLLLIVAGSAMYMLSDLHVAIAFMFPVFISSVGCSLILGSGAGQALAPFGDRAGTAAALLGLFQMSGSGVVVSWVQKLSYMPQVIVAIQMLFVIPVFLILLTKTYRRWQLQAA